MINFLGLRIDRNKISWGREVAPKTKALTSVSEGRGGWFPIIRESFTGAWQRNITVNTDLVLSYHAVFSCITLIASDISKLRVMLMVQGPSGIWEEITSSAFSPVLRDPNNFQTRNQFYESWLLSKLINGNTYVLMERGGGGLVRRLYLLDPRRVHPLISVDSDGEPAEIFYRLEQDNLSGVSESIVVPASEIIHDRMNTLFHPLVGVSPIYANGLAATQGLNIQQNSTRFFANNSQPGGLLIAPEAIPEDDAKAMRDLWEQNFSGDNAGRVAVLGGGLKFEPLAMTAVESQMIEQLKWSAEIVCGCFHVPPYKINVGPTPLNNNVQALNTEYYSQCLQRLIEDIESCLDKGLGIGIGVGERPYYCTKFDINNLLRMDSATQAEYVTKLVTGSVMAPNEGRAFFELPPVPGGNSPMAQHQNYSLEALDRRNNSPDPFGTSAGDVPKPVPQIDPADNGEVEDEVSDATKQLILAGKVHLAASALAKHLDMAA